MTHSFPTRRSSDRNQVFPGGGRAGRAIDDLLGDYSNPVTGSVRVYRERDEIRFQPLDAPIFNGRLRPLGGNVHTINFDEMALAPQPLDRKSTRLNSSH